MLPTNEKGGELLVVAMEKEIARAILAAEERATLRERERYAPAVRLLAAWDACNAHEATYEQAYYRLAKYARNDWEALREAITQKENSE